MICQMKAGVRCDLFFPFFIFRSCSKLILFAANYTSHMFPIQSLCTRYVVYRIDML